MPNDAAHDLSAIALAELSARRASWRTGKAALLWLIDPPEPGSGHRSLRHKIYSRGTRWLPGRWRRRIARRAPHLSIHRPTRPGARGASEILLVSHDLDASGAPKIVLDMAELLIAQGHRVTVVSPRGGPYRDALVAIGAAVVIDEQALHASPLVRRLAGSAVAAICNTALCYRIVRAIAPATPCFWYLHEISQTRELLAGEPMFAEALRAARGLWAGSELSAQIVRPCRGDVAVLPYGVTPFASAPPLSSRAAGRTLRMAVFGTVEPRKGQDLAVAAMAALAPAEAKQVELRLFGRFTRNRAFADALLAAVGELPNVRYEGELALDAYRRAMAECDAVLVSSRDDTLPLVSLDALSSGRLLMCTPTTGTTAYLEEGVNGFVAAETSAEAIRAMLERAIRRRDDWSGIGEAGARTFARTFSRAAFSAHLDAAVRAATAAAPGTAIA